jgi:peptidyl-prolyl cis-trans isomerase SurA
MRCAALVPTLVLLIALPHVARAQGTAAKPSTPTTSRPTGTTGRPVPRPAAPHPAAHSTGRLDGIAAVVNDDVVLQSDVEEQLYLFLMRAQAQPDSATIDTLRRQVLDQLIDEKLVVAEAKRQGVTVPESEINKEVDQAIADAKQRMGSTEAFQAQLGKENLTEAKLREKYHDEVQRQMLGQRLLQKQFPRKPVTVTEAEAYFKAHPDKFPKAPVELRLSVIQIPVEADSGRSARALTKIQAIRKRIVGGEKFAKVAQETSDDTESARAGGDLGYFARGNTEPEFERAAFAQKIGELGPPVRSTFGWHLIEVLERDTMRTATGRDSLDDDGKPVLEAHARHILVKVVIDSTDILRARQLADRVHSEAVKGTDFTTLVKRYSKYIGPASPDGDLGFVSLATLSPNIRAGLEPLKPGQVSDVLVNQRGFNIFKVGDRHDERAFTYAEVKNELPTAVANIQYREKYDTWVKSLRTRARIQYR